MKNLWFRAGVTLQLNDDEVDTILKTGADDNGDMDIVENVVKTALQEGRFAFDGNSYFPEPGGREPYPGGRAPLCAQ